MSDQTPTMPPAPHGWNKTIEDLFDEARAGKRASVGSPEIDWARDYERSLIPAGTRFPKKGDVYEARRDVQVSYLTSWGAPYTGGGTGVLKTGERVIVENDPLPRPISADGKAVDYAKVEARMIPERDRTSEKYAGFYLSLKTVDLGRDFNLVHENPALAQFQGAPDVGSSAGKLDRAFLLGITFFARMFGLLGILAGIVFLVSAYALQEGRAVNTAIGILAIAIGIAFLVTKRVRPEQLALMRRSIGRSR
jgi:hypothetical protein